MLNPKFTISLLLAGVAVASSAYGAEPDILVLVDGEKLAGHLESATGSSVVFKSDILGEVTVPWSKIQDLHSSQKFAAIPKGVKLHGREDAGRVPQGPLTATGQQVQIDPGGPSPKTIPTGDVSNVVDSATFQRAFERSRFVEGWKGGATAGVALTQATQKSQMYTAALNLVRVVPSETWLDPRSRTILDFNSAYGKLSQPGTPTVKTSIYHAGAEQDWFLSSRLFVFAHAIFDHSFSQGLDLQQTYGGGLGFVVFKRTCDELDFKVSVDYVDRRFQISSQNSQLIASTFGETYVRTFAHGILLNQQAGIIPAWNNTSAYSAIASAALTFPVYRHFGLTLGALDNFLNNPPPGFRKNSFQFTAGATYSFQ